MTDQATRLPSATTAAAVAFVAARRPDAEAAGRRLADLIDEPGSLLAALEAELAGLADPAFAAGLARVAPGIEGQLGVRGPLLHGLRDAFLRAVRRASPARLLPVAERVARSPIPEARWVAIDLMDRLVAADPERTWQLMRGSAAEAGEWITVDTLASPWARGILREPYRWSEIEQLVFATSRWERRLVGSTIARMPFVDRRAGREPLVARRGLDAVGSLIGDASPDVQKALSWALRSLTLVDAPAVAAFCRAEARTAVDAADGARAWVIRDTLEKLDPAEAGALRDRLAGIRRRPNAASTSVAARSAAGFGSLRPAASVTVEPFA